MSVTAPLRLSYRLAILSLLSIVGACTVSEIPSNRYQDDIEVSMVEARPVTKLQNQALAALGEEQFQLAIDYLQRAIKIQPRNAWSWHYLADVHWRQGERDRCLAMIERSQSYANYDDQLDDANELLKLQCR